MADGGLFGWLRGALAALPSVGPRRGVDDGRQVVTKASDEEEAAVTVGETKVGKGAVWAGSACGRPKSLLALSGLRGTRSTDDS